MKQQVLLLLQVAMLCFVYGCSKQPDLAASEEHFAKGQMHYESGDYKLAIDSFTKAIHNNPKSAKAYLCRGLARRTIHGSGSIPIAGGSLGTLIIGSADFDKAIELSPDYAEAYYCRGDAYEAAKFYNRATQDYRKAVSLIEAGAPSKELLSKVDQRLKLLEKRVKDGSKGWDN